MPELSVRFCFFIDGLDEYTGEHQDLVRTIAEFSRSSAVKFCVSSRPWNVFRKAYNNSRDRKLDIQDFTKRDIEEYIDGTLV